MVELGVNLHHQTMVLSYMKFARYLRSQNLKQIDHSFQVVDSRLFDDTFTRDEVKDLLVDTQKMVACDAESELINFAHNNVLMLQQLCQQAEKWHLRLSIDLSELQNQELLELIQKLETDETQLKPSSVPTEEEREEGTIALLRLEIERLREDNERLSNVIQEVEDKADLYKEEKTNLNDKLVSAQKEMKNYKIMLEERTEAGGGEEGPAVAEMKEKLSRVEILLSTNKEDSKIRQDKLVLELNSTREKVKQVEAQLQLAELELERKFSETKAYANMKQILVKKNDQIKDLRTRLLEFQPDMEDHADEE